MMYDMFSDRDDEAFGTNFRELETKTRAEIAKNDAALRRLQTYEARDKQDPRNVPIHPSESNERAEAAQALLDEERRQERITDDAWERNSRAQTTKNFLDPNSGMSYEEYIDQQQNISAIAGKNRFGPNTNQTLYHGLPKNRGQLETVLNANRAIGQQRQKLQQGGGTVADTGRSVTTQVRTVPLTNKERNDRVTQILDDHRRLDRDGSYDQTAFNQLKDIGFTDAQARGFLTGPATRRGDDNVLGHEPYDSGLETGGGENYKFTLEGDEGRDTFGDPQYPDGVDPNDAEAVRKAKEDAEDRRLNQGQTTYSGLPGEGTGKTQADILATLDEVGADKGLKQAIKDLADIIQGESDEIRWANAQRIVNNHLASPFNLPTELEVQRTASESATGRNDMFARFVSDKLEGVAPEVREALSRIAPRWGEIYDIQKGLGGEGVAQDETFTSYLNRLGQIGRPDPAILEGLQEKVRRSISSDAPPEGLTDAEMVWRKAMLEDQPRQQSMALRTAEQRVPQPLRATMAQMAGRQNLKFDMLKNMGELPNRQFLDYAARNQGVLGSQNPQDFKDIASSVAGLWGQTEDQRNDYSQAYYQNLQDNPGLQYNIALNARLPDIPKSLRNSFIRNSARKFAQFQETQGTYAPFLQSQADKNWSFYGQSPGDRIKALGAGPEATHHRWFSP
jgi:hypothetical protein